MTNTREPERELVRRLLPFLGVGSVVALGVGWLAGGSPIGWSAALGAASVAVLCVASATSIGWAARTSPEVLMVVGLGGFLVRLAAFTVALLLLDQLTWFSPLAFIAAFAPATIALLALEMRLLAGRMQADLWYFPEKSSPERTT
jgi:hypothetical protein